MSEVRTFPAFAVMVAMSMSLPEGVDLLRKGRKFNMIFSTKLRGVLTGDSPKTSWWGYVLGDVKIIRLPYICLRPPSRMTLT